MPDYASYSKIKSIIYENLSVSPTTYGTLATNARFKSAYIDDAIVSADIKTLNILKRNKKDSLLKHLWNSATSLATNSEIPTNTWAIIRVEKTSDGSKLVEVPYPQFRMLQNFSSGFNSAVNNKYYAFADGKIYHNVGSNVTIVRIPSPTYPEPLTASDIKSPAGFENVVASFATAQLLMKRLDRPEESQFYTNQAYSFLQEYGIPESPIQESSDLQ